MLQRLRSDTIGQSECILAIRQFILLANEEKCNSWPAQLGRLQATGHLSGASAKSSQVHCLTWLTNSPADSGRWSMMEAT